MAGLMMMMMIMVLWAVLATPVTAQGLVDDGVVEVVVEPLQDVVLVPKELIQVIEGTEHVITWYTILPDVAKVTATVEDEMVAGVKWIGDVKRGSPNDNFTYTGQLNISALFIGYNKVHIHFYDRFDEVVGSVVLKMSVLLSYQDLNNIFTLILGVLVALVYVNMGATIDPAVIKGIAKKPVGPGVGLFCQYIFMPLIAFGLGKLAFPGNPLGQLGLFLMGCCPGGGASNMWTFLLGGSLDLSIMMTFFSTVVAFGAVPLWVFMLGSVIMQDAAFVVPYKDIAVLVLSLSIPCVIGLLIQRFLPRVAKVLEKLLTPMSIFIIIFIFTFGIYANLYVFSLFTYTSILAGFGLPTLGYLSGLTLATLLKLPLKERIAISIETGIQNGSVAIFILKFTLEKPAGDLTVLFPAAAVIMTPLPLITAFIIRRIYLWWTRDKHPEGGEGKGGDDNKDGKKDNGRVVTNGKDTTETNDNKRNGVNGATGLDNPAMELGEETL